MVAHRPLDSGKSHRPRRLSFAFFHPSLESDWDNPCAHFLRGVVTELLARGHVVTVYEPCDAPGMIRVLEDYGEAEVERFRVAYRGLNSHRYELGWLDLERALEGIDVVVAHETTHPSLLKRLGAHRARHPETRLFVHATTHRCVSEPEAIGAVDWGGFDGVLAAARSVGEVWTDQGWVDSAWAWHPAADTRMFRPHAREEDTLDLVFVGNWARGERAGEMATFLIEPVRRLQLRATVYGVGYPAAATESLRQAGVRFGDWLPNYRVPAMLARYAAALHLPRAPFAGELPGVVSSRVFEAMACGVPLVTSPWTDADGLFMAGRDYLLAKDGAEMKRLLEAVLTDSDLARSLAVSGLEVILERHTCLHRVDELLEIAWQTLSSDADEDQVTAEAAVDVALAPRLAGASGGLDRTA